MSKYILIGGHQFPIAIETPVVTYDADPNWSFYNWIPYIEANFTPEKVTFLKQVRPKGRLWSKRSRQLQSEPQAGAVADIDKLQDRVWQVVLHHDSTLTSKVCFKVLVGRGLSTHFCLNWDGALYQVLDVYDASWATGKNNPYCIAIDLNNPADVGRASTDVAKPPRQIFSGRINGKKKSGLGYTEAQYATLIALFKTFKDAKIPGDPDGRLVFPQLSERFFPPYDAEGNVASRLLSGHTKFHGFLGHWHCSPQKWDPGPGFDWERVVAGIHGEKNSFPVVLPGTSNLNDLQGSLEGVTETYFENIEGDDNGGWYPIGAGQSWHSGVHLHTNDEGTDVLAMIKGEIIAVRNTQRVELGDPSFVLIRHDYSGDEEAEEPIQPYFSLYMHLQQQTKADVMETIPWMATLLDGSYDAPESDPFGDDSGRPKHLQQPIATEDDPKLRQNDYQAFWEGDIILTSIPVSPGDLLGKMGVFGTSEWTVEPLVHVEIMAPHLAENKEANFGNIITETGADWTVVEAEVENTNLISIDKILEPIIEAVDVKRKGGERVLKTSDVQEFFADEFNDPTKRDFRRMITLHISEWSTNIDWRKTAAHAVGWSWQTQEAFAYFLSSWFPFMWMNEVVSEWAGFPESHRFFYYHPIYLLTYMARNYTVTVKDEDAAKQESNKALKTAQEQEAEEKRIMQARISELSTKQNSGEKLTPEEDQELFDLILTASDRHEEGEADLTGDDILYENLPEFTKWEPGEWDVPK